MKSYILKPALFFLFTFVFASLSFSQERSSRQQKKEKIEQLKIAFFTTELDLTKKEAQEFWPVYNDLQSALRIEKRLQKKTSSELKANLETLSDSELRNKTNTIFNSQIKEVELKKSYQIKIAQIIGDKKAVKLLSLEQRFKRELLNKLNEGKRPQGNRPSGGRPN
ncbi:MAG: hypothetical protein ACPGVI_04885 [Crocinitomicaceae bacterium]